MKTILVILVYVSGAFAPQTLFATQDLSASNLPSVERVFPDRPFRAPPFADAQFTSDGDRLVMATFDRPGICILDTATGQVVKTIRLTSQVVQAQFGGIAIDSTDRFALIGVREFARDQRVSCRIELWDLETGERVQSYFFPGSKRIEDYRVCFWGDESRVAAVEGERLCIWDRESGEIDSESTVLSDRPSYLNYDFDPRSQQLVVARRDGMTEIIAWEGNNIEQSELVSEVISTSSRGGLVSVAKDGRITVSNSQAPYFQVIEDGIITHRISTSPSSENYQPYGILAPVGEVLVAAGLTEEGGLRICVWDLETESIVSTREMSKGWIPRTLQFDPHGERLMFRNYSGDIAFLSLPQLNDHNRPLPHIEGTFCDLLASVDEEHIISLSNYGEISIWNSSDQAPVQTILTSLNGSLFESPSGDRVAVIDLRGNIEVFERESGSLLFEQHNDSESRIYLKAFAWFENEQTIRRFDSQFGMTTIDLDTGEVSAKQYLFPTGISAESRQNIRDGQRDRDVSDLRPRACLHADNSRIVISMSNAFAVFDPVAGELVATHETSIYRNACVTSCPGSNDVLCGWMSDEGTPGHEEGIRRYYVGRFDLNEGIWKYKTQVLSPVEDIQVDSSGTRFVITYVIDAQPYAIGDTATGEILHQWGDTNHLRVNARFMLSNAKVMAVEDSNQIVIWDVSDVADR